MTPSTPLFPSSIQSLAIFADVHGNIRGLEAVLDDIAGQAVDAVVCNGDLLTGSAHAAAVVRRVRELGILCTRGNHERYLAELADPEHEKWRQANWAPIQWDYRNLSQEDVHWLQSLPGLLWLCDGASPLFMAHAAPGDDSARVTAQNSDADWVALFADFPARTTLVGSHLHWFWQQRWRDRHFVRTPSAGLPLDGDTRAGYVILRRSGAGWRVEHRRVGYDLEAELEALRGSDYYRECGVMARLFWEELRTARGWILPFFMHLRQSVPALAHAPAAAGVDAETLEAALRTFDRSAFPEYRPDEPAPLH